MGDQVALVIGGSSGIGLAAAKSLAACGMETHVTGRDEVKLAAVSADDGIRTHRLDGASRADMAMLADRVGDIDVLILSMGGARGAGPFADLDVEELRAGFEEKFWGHVNSVQALLPRMKQTGSITFVGAISAHAGVPGSAGLAAINAAVEALVRPLAVELAPIRVNAVSPGAIDTPWWNVLPGEQRAAYFAQLTETLPVRRVGAPEDVAEGLVFAATNRYLTGTVIQLDGGVRLV